MIREKEREQSFRCLKNFLFLHIHLSFPRDRILWAGHASFVLCLCLIVATDVLIIPAVFPLPRSAQGTRWEVESGVGGNLNNFLFVYYRCVLGRAWIRWIPVYLSMELQRSLQEEESVSMEHEFLFMVDDLEALTHVWLYFPPHFCS